MASSIERLNVAPFEQSMLYLVLAENANRSGANSDAHVKTALKTATQIEDPIQAMECSFIIAKTIASREAFSEDDLKQLQDAITQVRFDLEALEGTSRENSTLWLTKYTTLLKCAAFYWKVGQQELADEYGELAYSMTSLRSRGKFEISVFQAMIIFAMAGDIEQVTQFQHISSGRLNLLKKRNLAPYASELMKIKYKSLMNANLFVASKDNSADGGFHETFCQSMLAMTFARAGDSDRTDVHYRKGNLMTSEYAQRLNSATVKSQSHSLLAITEAHQEDYVSAKRRLESVENSGMLAEAALLSLIHI